MIDASVGAELERAVAAAKRELGVETTANDVIAARLPEHLRQPFWEQAVGRYLEAELARLGLPPEGTKA